MNVVQICLIVLGAAAFLAADYWIAKEFYKVASMKGWPEPKYFWIAFLVPLAGQLLVAALPDRGRPGMSIVESRDLPEL